MLTDITYLKDIMCQKKRQMSVHWQDLAAESQLDRQCQKFAACADVGTTLLPQLKVDSHSSLLGPILNLDSLLCQ